MRMLVAIAVMCAMNAQAVLAAEGDAGLPILNDASFWRWHNSYRKPVVAPDKLQAGNPDILPVHLTPYSSRPDIEQLETAPPPADWITPQFDDSTWARGLVPDFGRGYYQDGMICLRGRFNVGDPAATTGLLLSAEYRGGIVVYLNGKEVARKDLPAGELTGRTAALPYPDKNWVDAEGKMLIAESKIGRTTPAEVAEPILSRNRKIAADLPASDLRKGVNVVAVAVYRSDYHPIATTWFRQSAIFNGWWPIRLTSISLSARGGATANVAPPAGVFVRAVQPCERLNSNYFADPNEPVGTVRIVAARNGTFNGMVAVSSDQPTPKLSAVMSDLSADGGGKLPSTAVRVQYLIENNIARMNSARPHLVFDALVDEPPPAKPTPPVNPKAKGPAKPAGHVQPIWIRVDVPADAAPGVYKGSLKVSGDGLAQSVDVPVEVQVAAFTLPSPRQFRTHAGIYQSPTSLAMQYKVDLWSPEHWKLMDKSFAMLARAGNKIVNINVAEQTQFGDDEGLVRWVRKPDGAFDYDFSLFDSYIELTKKHLGVPTFVALQVWHSAGWSARKVDTKLTVTVIDPKTGKRIESLQVPPFGTPEAKAFWTPAMKAIGERLARAGMDKSMCLGILSDSTAPTEVFAMFREIVPDVGWTRGCHTQTREPKPYGLSHAAGAKVVYHEYCYGQSIPSPDKKIARIHDQHGPGTSYFRSDFDSFNPLHFFYTPERSLYMGNRGFGRNCLDFWEFQMGKVYSNIYNRYEHSSCAQREPTATRLAAPGPDGPLSTVRFEMLISGIQEAEAAIVISEALDKHADKLGAELAGRCRQLLIDRINNARLFNDYMGTMTLNSGNWQRLSAELFNLAAEVAARTK